MKSTMIRCALLSTIATAVALVPAIALAQVAPAPAPAPAASAAPATPTPTSGAATNAGSVTAMSDNITPSWGNLRSFWGDNTPFWGNLRSFWGDTGPYATDLTPFWGNLRSFNDTATDTALLPAWGNLRSFAGDLGASWGNLRSFWGNLRSFSDAPQDYTTLATMLQSMNSQSKAVFGTAVQTQTGQSFDVAFANPLFAKYGINLSNPASLQNLDASTREHFFLDWWDGLMNYSGADHVDHWMKEVNWSPSLTQQVGMSGTNSTVGILDFSITGAASNNVVKYGGVSTVANGHGAAVASLIVDPIDGKGVMGIAPSASVIAYNPFDATQTAGWADITNGVAMLTKNGATIINMSLGVPGWTLNQGWNTVFQDKTVKPTAARQVFVIAAGNDGISQTQNITWKADNPQFLVVGSVDPTGTISSFSNRPGSACLTDDKGNCGGDYLMNHFLVAPGEMILVSDGQGGVTRMSGTSFAAPLVSGTVALIQDRWPWLDDHPKDVVGIVLKSAKDLGAPGVDPVYGYGELDVQAALSPLDWTKLTIKQSVNGKVVDVKLPQLQQTTAAVRSTWEANSVYFALFENTGESFRDFEVPMSSKLVNQTVSVAGSQEQFMSYLSSRFSTLISGAGSPTGPAGPAGPAPAKMRFTDLTGSSQQLAMLGGAQAALTMRPRVTQMGFQTSQVPFESSLRLTSPNQQFAAELGNGQSAVAVAGQSGFGMASDYDPTNGGANPFLGFASGGSYARVQAVLAPGLAVSSGFSRHDLRRSFNALPLAERIALGSSKPYGASAANMTVTYQASQSLTTSVAYTMLNEDSAVLGMASVNPNDLPQGSTTDAATLGVDFAVMPTLALSTSATVGRTRAGNQAEGALAIGPRGITSTAFQVAMNKDHLFDVHDRLRLTMAQPMHVENGSLDVSNVQVVDRETGELGVVTQRAGISGGQRRYVAELLYGRRVMGGIGELSLFGRANIDARISDQVPSFIGGTSFRMNF